MRLIQALDEAGFVGWKRRILNRLEEGIRSQTWDITDDHDPAWIKDNLIPYLRNHGLIVTFRSLKLYVVMRN